MNIMNTPRFYRLLAGCALASVLADLLHGAAPATSSGAACWRYEQMRPADLAEALRVRPVAWLAFSPLEWHGEAISFCSDPLVARTVVERAWQRAGGVLLPTLYLGVETEYKSWDKERLVRRWGMEYVTKQHNPGSLYIQPLTMELVLRDLLTAMQREGFKVCVVMTGHLAMDQLKVLYDVCGRDWGTMKVVPFETLADAKLPEPLRFPGAPMHAGADELSLVGAIDRAMVAPEVFGRTERDRSADLKHEDAGKIDFEKGRAIIDANVEELVKRVNAALAQEK